MNTNRLGCLLPMALAALLGGCGEQVPIPQPISYVDMVRTADNKSTRGIAGYDMAAASCNDVARDRARAGTCC